MITGFKKNIGRFALIGFVITLGLIGLELHRISRIQTTTPEEFINHYHVSEQIYEHDKEQVINTVDSLISIEIVYRPAEKALRVFDGSVHEDTIDRQWAIDLPMKSNHYLKHEVDTIIYRPNDQNTFAGILVSKTQNRFATDGIRYEGNGFVCKRQGGHLDFKIKGYRVSGNTFENCRDGMRKIYFREMGLGKNSFNLDDTRYWTTDEVKAIQ